MRNITIIGNLTRDAEKRSTSFGDVIGFSLAVTRRRKKDDDTPPLYFDISAFDGVGERIFPYLKKGKPIAVVGEFNTREFERKDGTKGTSLDIRAASIDFVNVGNGGNRNADGAPATAAPAPALDDDDQPW